ncbi:uncharacterized protein BDW43DRAFT_291623 [Aspergillus alliaceus]|uniref:uncharacterized protein n=1 Tax=Petromyces alliaceus TaxID=209559 RepID=UPI0012A52FC6|nr:uncharacterized protein BDW43DRAFT_291623 [Aspergillus alliaceus]KAB8228284.1 hypothetical protein BDW43DRAFT_291623 [Aspergillus alliaceus]
MVGRCSKGRRRRKRGPDSSPMATERTSATDPGGLGNSSQTSAFRPFPVSADSSTGVDRVPIDLNLTPLLNWDSGTGPDLAGPCTDEDSNILFADRNASTTDDAFRDALNQPDISSLTEDYTSGLHMAFTASSAIDHVHTTLPHTSYTTMASTATQHTSENIVQRQTTRVPGSSDKQTGISILFNVMTNLEAEIGDPGSSIDKIMYTVKTSTKEVQRVIQSRQRQLAVIGPMLALVAIEVALILIEHIISRYSSSKNTSLNNYSISDQQNPRALLLGQYRAESEEAAIIWRHITIVELQRLHRLIEVLRIYLDDSSRCQNSQRPVDRLKSSCAYQEQKIALLLATLQRHEEIVEEGTGSML